LENRFGFIMLATKQVIGGVDATEEVRLERLKQKAMFDKEVREVRNEMLRKQLGDKPKRSWREWFFRKK
jgi:hypothetical protein